LVKPVPFLLLKRRLLGASGLRVGLGLGFGGLGVGLALGLGGLGFSSAVGLGGLVTGGGYLGIGLGINLGFRLGGFYIGLFSLRFGLHNGGRGCGSLGEDGGGKQACLESRLIRTCLVVDNLRVHHATLVKEWLADKTDKIELVFLPPYAPESNPDEYLNRHFKTALRTGAVSHDKKTLLEKAIAFMRQLATMPERVKAYFRHPAAA